VITGRLLIAIILSKRTKESKELMDDLNCDLGMLNNTYRQFKTINKLFSCWNIIYHFFLKPRMKSRDQVYLLLDIGFGGGDIPIQLAKWAKADGINLQVTAIEIDQRALDYIKTIQVPSNVSFRRATTTDLLNENKSFDFVINNNTCHHWAEKELHIMMENARKLCRNLIVFNDIERGDLAFVFYTVIAKLFFHHSFIYYDGRFSIKRSYTKSELKEITPVNWTIKRLFPYRLLLIHEPNGCRKNSKI
jgi:2-polyprenyl-3-methyl-5-hydroxy-6-metoxy-1,4-benzoquinol methylase